MRFEKKKLDATDKIIIRGKNDCRYGTGISKTCKTPPKRRKKRSRAILRYLSTVRFANVAKIPLTTNIGEEINNSLKYPEDENLYFQFRFMSITSSKASFRPPSKKKTKK